MSSVVAGEGHQDHVNNGEDGEEHDANQGQSQQGLVELIVHQRPEVILAALDFLALSGDVGADAALLHLQAPGIDKADDEQNGEQAVKHDLYGIVTGLPDFLVPNRIVDEAALDSTDGFTGLEPVALLQPVDTAAGTDHVGNKDRLKQEEEQAAHDLSVVNISKTKDKEGQLYCPVTLGKGSNDVENFVFDGLAATYEEGYDAASQLDKPTGNAGKEQLQIVPETLQLAQLEILQII